jgi:hypothetical protein
MKKLLLLIVTVLALASCATQKKVEYIDREVERTEKEYIHDTLNISTHDSIYVSVKQVGDTVFETKYVEHVRWRDKVVERIDTVLVDNVKTEYFETVIEDKVVPKWCYIFIFTTLLCCVYFLFKLKKAFV